MMAPEMRALCVSQWRTVEAAGALPGWLDPAAAAAVDSLVCARASETTNERTIELQPQVSAIALVQLG